jgi:hypothetical protein
MVETFGTPGQAVSNGSRQAHSNSKFRMVLPPCYCEISSRQAIRILIKYGEINHPCRVYLGYFFGIAENGLSMPEEVKRAF